MICEYGKCTKDGTEGVVLDPFRPTKVVCPTHAKHVKRVQRTVTSLLSQARMIHERSNR